MDWPKASLVKAHEEILHELGFLSLPKLKAFEDRVSRAGKNA